ncbi:MAG: hypothetical protein ISF22_04970 [Methanomassiliicoccus sp.]|nr:hypothetical protein [Methanomassiliicoccus sp.]
MNVPEKDIPNVYEYLLTAVKDNEAYLDIVTRMARFSPIYPDDPEWQSVVLDHDDRIFDLLNMDMTVIGIELGGRCIGYFGYRIASDPQVVIRRHEVVLPFDLTMAVDDDVEVSDDMIYSAQLYVASHENLREVVMATC